MSEPEGQKEASSLRRLAFVARPVLAALAGLFVGYTIYDLSRRWDGGSVSVEPVSLFLALVLSAGAMLMQLSAFRALLFSWLGERLPYVPSAKLYLDSQVARYTPGKVGLLAVRMMGAAKLGVPPKAMGASLLVEMLSWVSTGALFGAGAFLISPELSRSPESVRVVRLISVLPPLVCASSAAFLVGLVTVDRRSLPDGILRVLGAPGRGALVPLRVPLLHLLHFLFLGLSGAALTVSVGGSLAQGVVVGGVLCGAIVAGFLALFAPAGAGIREAIVIAFAAPLVGPARALAISLLARMISVASDLLLFAWFRYRARAGTSKRSRS